MSPLAPVMAMRPRVDWVMLRLSGAVLAAALVTVLLPSCAARAQVGEGCVVAQVVDGDTLRCADGTRVRLIGIDAPERDQGPSFTLARAALARLAPVRTSIRLERDAARIDRYGRRLAHAWRGDTLINEALVRGGWAVLYTLPPNVKYARRLEAAQRRARQEGQGLWADGGFDCAPSAHRRREC